MTMKHSTVIKTVLITFLFSVPSISLAWDYAKVEISPFIGYMVGGSFQDRYGDSDSYGDIDLGSAGTWGLRLGVGIARGVGFEWQFSHSPSAFYVGGNSDLFSDHGSKITDVDLYNLEGSLIFDLGHGPIMPYIAFGMGTTLFDMDQGDSKGRFNASLAGGLNFRINPNLYFRTEMRAYGILVNSDNCPDCDEYYHDYNDGSDVLTTVETTFGLAVKL
jgi:hypothetical protein